MVMNIKEDMDVVIKDTSAMINIIMWMTNLEIPPQKNDWHIILEWS